MKRTILTLIATFVLVGTAYGLLSRKRLNTAMQLTVVVDNVGFLGGNRGTGILTDSTHILTCAHIIHNTNDEFYIYTYPLGRVYKATVEMTDKNDDIALLVLSSSAPITAKVKFGEAEIGDEITVIGNALGVEEWVVTHGIAASGERGYLLTDALINPGNSGGPWVNNKGEVVAMTDWSIGPNEEKHMRGICGGIDARKIKEVLDGYHAMRALQEMPSK